MSLSPRDPLVVGRVVGDVVDPFMRLISLDVTYGQREITNGMDLRSSQVLNKPTVEIGGDDLRNFYNFGYGGSRCAKSKQPVPPRIPPLVCIYNYSMLCIGDIEVYRPTRDTQNYGSIRYVPTLIELKRDIENKLLTELLVIR
ncbi:BnaCnng48850D [Brassica napus]|uniref:(rape) hypothetical protein n=1 Tax=Brassica napus TaxID=3708 RepID=A0A078JKG6_BRANA|nr:unnamed protein product [Brassica napus]CDY65847.1 BnaCnng48850D [Brassica napus]